MAIDTGKLKEWLYRLNSIFNELEVENRTWEMYHQKMDTDQQMRHSSITDDLEDTFKYLAGKVYLSILAYVEHMGLTEHHKTCREELTVFLKDKKSLLDSGYYAPSGDEYSKFIEKCWMLLSPFSEFNEESDDKMLKKTGLIYLEHILNSTAVIIKALRGNPTSETAVYSAVKIVISSTFPDANHPSESFQKTAKCYKPDILIPSLNCAVEYKYAKDEKTLIKTIDEILIDVEGYRNNRIYKNFYAVFYVKSGIWTSARFDAVWKEKEFPENWKGIMVVF